MRFQSTHPYRVWPVEKTKLASARKFQSTHPYRVWLRLSNLMVFFSSFNPHTHTGCDFACVFYAFTSMMFQSTHPYRVWRIHLLRCQIPWSFNPHTHTGCDFSYCYKSFCKWVSIHTPIQGVTESCRIHRHSTGVSIHTPIQGVTLQYRYNRILCLVSIHTPIQGVTESGGNLCDACRVSIHTPIQGVTARRWCRYDTGCSFNPHTHTGCDITHDPAPSPTTQFQSTHPYRVWQQVQTIKIKKLCFNPHTHTGCDLGCCGLAVGIEVSIHTPIQGVTYAWSVRVAEILFQSTHPYRVWLSFTHAPLSQNRFQSTHPYRVWLVIS